MQRFKTTYLDVVFCHNVEFVGEAEAVEAVGTLFELVQQGRIRYVGISGYDLDVLSRIAKLVLQTYRQPVDVVQTWAQLTLQNTRLESHGLPLLKAAGVRVVCASSPLAVGLLSSKGVLVGGPGDWHPAPEGLRLQARQAVRLVKSRDDSAAALALRFAIRKAVKLSSPELQISTISGVVSLDKISMNINTACQVLGCDLAAPSSKDSAIAANVEQQDDFHAQLVRSVLCKWLDYDFSTQKIAAEAPKAQ